jgi:SAM-dependent methyltransferase
MHATHLPTKTTSLLPNGKTNLKCHPEWVIASVSGGANALWLTEWLAAALDLRPGMRVLDLGCGRAMSSIFLRREFGVQVWATDLWFSASENIQRIRDAGVEDGVFPIHADARSLPFAADFFDAIASIDSFIYYGTDDLYLNYFARFVKPGGPVGIAVARSRDSEVVRRDNLVIRAEPSAVPAWQGFSHQRMRFRPVKVLTVSCRPDFFSERSPSARTSKGFLISGTRVTPSSLQFKHTNSRIRRFIAFAAWHRKSRSPSGR